MSTKSLAGKKIILGITGGIAAYKACLITRQLISKGAEVRVLMTPAACEFITPLTLSTLSGNEVIVNIFPESQSNGTNNRTWHIDYGIWADLMLIAPATINTVAKIAHGFADNALTSVVAALRSKLIVAPAADMDMYNSGANLENIEKLKSRGAFIVEAENGFLASGLSGKGRMAEPAKILEAVELVLSGFTNDFFGKNVLITAGPTYEDIDPVRFIGNRSSGKMGCELAKTAFLRGANVTVITGPSNQQYYPEINVIKVRSANEMELAVKQNIDKNDVLIMSAAVADYKPAHKADRKIKKENNLQSIELEKTSDILQSIKGCSTKVIGFALETDNELQNALVKLQRKNLEMIVLNSLQEKGAGFEFDTNKITIIKKDGSKKEFGLVSKFETANNILSEIKNLL